MTTRYPISCNKVFDLMIYIIDVKKMWILILKYHQGSFLPSSVNWVHWVFNPEATCRTHSCSHCKFASLTHTYVQLSNCVVYWLKFKTVAIRSHLYTWIQSFVENSISIFRHTNSNAFQSECFVSFR